MAVLGYQKIHVFKDIHANFIRIYFELNISGSMKAFEILRSRNIIVNGNVRVMSTIAANESASSQQIQALKLYNFQLTMRCTRT